MEASVYILCSITSLLCAALLLRSFRKSDFTFRMPTDGIRVRQRVPRPAWERQFTSAICSRIGALGMDVI